MPILIRKAQNGLGMIDTTGYHTRSASLLKKYKNLNWIKRATDKEFSLPPAEGNRSHYLGYGNVDEQLQAYPGTVQKEGENFLTNLSREEAFEEAKKTKSFVPLGQDKDFAEYFTIMGYKQKFPGKDYEEAKRDYSKLYNKK